MVRLSHRFKVETKNQDLVRLGGRLKSKKRELANLLGEVKNKESAFRSGVCILRVDVEQFH